MTAVEVVKKKRVNSKAKGATNERRIAKLLANALAPLQFVKTPGSGAFVGGKNFATRGGLFSKTAMQTFVGDIVCTNEEDVGETFDFVVECKHYKTPDSFDSIFTGKHSIYGWLEEVAIDCVKLDKQGIVIFKWNNTPYYAAVSSNINLPISKFLTLPSGDKICLLSDLLPFRDFWVSKLLTE
jgi:hypothetical protein